MCIMSVLCVKFPSRYKVVHILKNSFCVAAIIAATGTLPTPNGVTYHLGLCYIKRLFSHSASPSDENNPLWRGTHGVRD